MPAGTITLTNNSTAVTGSGTAFATELKANDFLVAIVGGTTYTLGVKSVESATALTLTTAYGGPTAGGLAWTPIPNGTLVGITAQIAADTARAIRGLNYDKQNWQQVYSASGNITVTLPDDSTYTGPSWKGIAVKIDDKADKASLDNYAKKGANTDITKISGLTTPLAVNQGGLGTTTVDGARQVLAVNGTVLTLGSINNVLTWHNDRYQSGGAFPLRDDDGTTLAYKYGAGMLLRTLDTFGYICVDKDTANLRVIGGAASGGIASYAYQNTLWGTRNTTVDNNGFIKQASPVVKIFSDGEFEVNDESEGVTVTRQGVGKYLIEGCTGLNADASWGGIDGGFEIPTDRNKQPRIWLDYEVNAEGSVLVKTYHRTHPDAPVFARNIIGDKNAEGIFTETVKDGESVDIPADSFVSVRVEMPADSIWNQKTEASRKATEQASRKALEESKAISNLKEE